MNYLNLETKATRPYRPGTKPYCNLYITKATAITTTATDPAMPNLFGSALLTAGAGASVGVAEIEDGDIAGASTGDSEGEYREDALGEAASTGDPVGDRIFGEETGDRANARLTNSGTTSINTNTEEKRAILERDRKNVL